MHFRENDTYGLLIRQIRRVAGSLGYHGDFLDDYNRITYDLSYEEQSDFGEIFQKVADELARPAYGSPVLLRGDFRKWVCEKIKNVLINSRDEQ